MSRSQRWTLVAAILGSGIVFLDGTVVNIALKKIGQELPTTFLGVLEGQAYVVSGYLAAESAQGAHLWAEAFTGTGGWVGFDPATGLVPAETHIRVAIGLDAGEAGAVRSARRGFAEETLAMDLAVQQVQGQQ